MGIYDTLSQLDAEKLMPAKQAPVVETPARQDAATTPQAEKRPSRRRDVTHDAVTSLLADVDLSAWHETIADTETHSSALRLSARERDAVEDLVRDLRRGKRIRTSMNELARLGLLLLIHDYTVRGEQSIVYRVKKS